MRLTQRRGSPGRLRRWPIGWALATCFAAGLAGLAWFVLTSPHPSGPASPHSSGPASLAAGAASPPVRVCGNKAILGGGPSVAPQGAVIIPAGDDSDTDLAHNWTMKPHTTYWFARGTHTLGTGQFSQIIPADGDTFLGAPDRKSVV